MLSSYEEKAPFGYPTCNSSIDEQALVHFYSRHLSRGPGKEAVKWTYVSQRSGWIMWKPEWLRSWEWPPTVFHYFGRKPWLLDRGEWLDLEPWYDYARAMLGSERFTAPQREVLRKAYRPEQLDKPAQGRCFYCQLVRSVLNQHMFSADGRVICPRYLAQLAHVQRGR